MSRYREDGGFYDPSDKGPGLPRFALGRSRPAFKGGGGGSTTQTTKVELPDYVDPYAKILMNRAYELSNGTMPVFAGERTAGLNSDQMAAINGIRERALNGAPDINAARSGLTSTIQGDYMRDSQSNPYAGANPYLDQAIQKTQGDIARNYAAGTGAQTLAQFRNSGAFGGSAMQETQDMQNRALGDALSNAGNSMRMQDYDIQRQIAAQDMDRNNANWNAERQRQMQAIGLAPSLANTDYQNYQALLGAGDIQRDWSQSQINDTIARWSEATGQPYQQLELLANGITGATGGGIARQQVGPNPNQANRTAGALGGALGGAGMGSMFGPWGTAIGGGLGLLGGLFG